MILASAILSRIRFIAVLYYVKHAVNMQIVRMNLSSLNGHLARLVFSDFVCMFYLINEPFLPLSSRQLMLLHCTFTAMLIAGAYHAGPFIIKAVFSIFDISASFHLMYFQYIL